MTIELKCLLGIYGQPLWRSARE